MISTVVPAHNEEQVIARSLAAIADGAATGEVEIVVVCNGCDDGTADVARRCGGPVKVIVTPTPGKSNALGVGDDAASSFPRFYVDADVVITFDSLKRMAERLAQGDVMAVSPRIRWNLAGASWAVRAFYDIDGRLPSHRETIGGSGVYGLSRAGRERLGSFPKVIADDGYVRRRFRVNERATVEGAWSVVTPPKSLSGVIAIKTRSHFGNYELNQLYPELSANIGASNRPVLLRLATRPWLWAKLAVYGYVKVMARVMARRRMRVGGQLQWDRDDTSRVPDPQAGRSSAAPIAATSPASRA